MPGDSLKGGFLEVWFPSFAQGKPEETLGRKAKGATTKEGHTNQTARGENLLGGTISQTEGLYVLKIQNKKVSFP